MVKRDGYGWLDCGHKMCTANNISVLSRGRLSVSTPSLFYNGHSIMDIVLFWEEISGQRLQRTTLPLDTKGEMSSPPRAFIPLLTFNVTCSLIFLVSAVLYLKGVEIVGKIT